MHLIDISYIIKSKAMTQISIVSWLHVDGLVMDHFLFQTYFRLYNQVYKTFRTCATINLNISF